MLSRIGESVITAVLAAVILAVLASVWQLVSGGGLITLLGGVTSSEIEGMSPFPKGAVVAFDLDQGCPEEGWSNYEDGYERTIIGATGPPFPEHPYAFRTKGGKEKIMLTEEHIPLHGHSYTDVYFTEVDKWRPNKDTTKGEEVPEGLGHATHNGKGKTVDKDNTGWARLKNTDNFGRDNDVRSAHTNLQPYIALHFCKRR